MPATEQTWRNQKLLHVIFGLTSLLLLVATIWMVAADHDRPWKVYQRKMRDIQQQMLAWRLRAEGKRQEQAIDNLEQAHSAAQSAMLDEAVIQDFAATAEGVGEFSFDRTNDVLKELSIQSGVAQDRRNALTEALRQLEQAEQAVATAGNADDSEALVAANTQLAAATEAVASVRSEVRKAEREAARLRESVLSPLRKIEARAKFQMDEATSTRKLSAAKFGAVTATQGLKVRDGDFEGAEAMQAEIDEVYKKSLDEATAATEETTARRNRLRELIGQLTADEDQAAKNLGDAKSELARLNTALDEGDVRYFSLKTVVGKKLLELPVVDAFNGPLKIDNLWTDGLTYPVGSFGEARRFDRCTTCHRGIDKTAPGSAVDPAYEQRHEVVLQMLLPEAEPATGARLEETFGIVLADAGLVDKDDVTVEFIAAESRAATAINISDNACAGGLIEGDVIRYIGGDKVTSNSEVAAFLLDPVDGWGSSIEVIVERGLPHPYSSHPRLDLFVGSLSPHKMTIIGCTVCHEGQGSATSFKYASHTPNSLTQEDEWRQDYGWFNNHHWIFPMTPARFTESTCLKCHHDVTELNASAQYPDPPAPKLVAGHNLIKAYGCFGCHEINGYKGPSDRVGPDLRLEPNYFAGAAQLLHDPTFQLLPEEEQALAGHLVQHPEDDRARHELLAVLAADARLEQPQLSPEAHKLADVLEDVDTPGLMRKVGPSLRHVGTKLSEAFLYDWIREPKHFRQNTKMPQFFGLWDHLQDDPESLEKSQRYEPVEIMGIVTYLLDSSQPVQQVPRAAGTLKADVERGQLAFETRGCLACHQHSAFDDANHGTITAAPRPGVSRQIQGPDLSNLGDKFDLEGTPDAQQWLYSWLRNPQLYHPRTKMPDTYLEPIKQKDGSLVDPAADIAAFLLASSNGWEPAEVELNPDQAVLEEVAYESLKKAFFGKDALDYIQNGIPEEMAASLKGDEVELLNVDGSKGDMRKKLLRYVGRKTIGKYGCYACHDIPGYEDAKPIGVALADWGRKDPSKIAFEHIAEYIHHGHGHGGHGHGDGHNDDGHVDASHDDHGQHAEQDVEIAESEPFDVSFYMHRLEHHDRTGFLYQKLREPRSYDYKKARNKDYNERLRMPMFPFTDEQREEVMTFILGLVAEPPATQFVYHPSERQKALNEGRRVLDKYNCAGCHVLETERWEIDYRPGEFEAPFEDATAYPFTNATLPTSDIEASQAVNSQRGTISGTLHGMPTITHPGREDNAHPVVLTYDDFDEEWYPAESGDEYDPSEVKQSITLWSPTAVEGHTMEVGQVLEVAAGSIKNRFRANGGDLTLRLLPRVLEIERQTNTAAKGGETWAWLPPSLHNEGIKVQPEWLHNFLLDPHPIRPAVFMRMPRFNMSPEEATAIVNYFAARDDAAYPYAYVERTRGDHIDQLEAKYVEQAGVTPSDMGIERLKAAMNVVTFKDYCVACHQVGDFYPTGAERAKAPNLATVYKRLRGDYVRDWIAKPTRVLPYTAMPVVIPYTGQPEQLVPQTMFHGTPVEQLDGVVDLLMNYDRYTGGRSSVAPMVKVDAATAAKP